MIQQRFVVICDFCGAVALAKEQGTQRDSAWVPPSNWSYGRATKNVNLCPECTELLKMKEKQNATE